MPDDDLDEGPSDADLERFGGVTRTCPECGTEVFDDAEVCWSCGHAGAGRATGGGSRAWIVVAAVLGIIAMAVIALR